MSALQHIEHLSVTIGARGSTTPREKEGHNYVKNVLDKLGCATRVESFSASPSIYLPVILGLGVALLGEALFFGLGRTGDAAVGAVTALLLGVLALGSILLEVQTIDNPLRWFLPVAPSQNVIGVTPAKGETKRRVAILAHVDTHRTPLIWHSRQTFAIYQIIVPLGLLSAFALCVCFAIGIFAPSELLANLSLIPTALVLVAWLMVLQAHNTPYTRGANDNASGVGVMLGLAERAQQAPLENTELWWVGTGCEEVGAYGSVDFIRRYAPDLKTGAVVVIDNIAGEDTGPVYLSQEGILRSVPYPPAMLTLADQVARAHPEWGGRVYPHKTGAFTDAFPALQVGLNVLTFVGYTRDGWLPNWHNVTDAFVNINSEAVQRTEEFVWAVLGEMDKG